VSFDNCSSVLFINDYVGFEILKYFLDNYPEDINSIVVTTYEDKEKVLSLGLKENDVLIFDYIKNSMDLDAFFKKQVDYFILAWWPKIINSSLIEYPKFGVINFHPSFLPYNRGKHYNFWNIVEDCPFGVTLHFVDTGIDTGDIIVQRAIQTSLLDDGKSLYIKARNEIKELFIDEYPNIRLGNYNRIKQDLDKGSMHYSRELDSASEVNITELQNLKSFIDKIRARTFLPYPSCYFYYNRDKYYIRSKIKSTMVSEQYYNLSSKISPENFLLRDGGILPESEIVVFDGSKYYKVNLAIEVEK